MAAQVLLVAACLLPVALSINEIELPVGNWGLSSVDASQKNSGGATLAAPTIGYINYSPIAPNKGQHMASAAAGIRAVNKTAAMALEQQASQATFTGQEAFTAALGTYLTYKGGKVFSEPFTMNVYLIFYGSKWSRKQREILKGFIASLDAKAPGYSKVSGATVAGWWAILSKFYYDSKKRSITSSVRLAGLVNDVGSQAPYGSQSRPLTHQQLQNIVAKNIDTSGKKPARGKLPVDVNGAYAVLTADDIYVQDFCTSICAFHTSGLIGGQKLAWAFAGNPAVQCPEFCTYKYYDSMFVPPNGDLGADAICDKLGHELAEVATNALHGPGDVAGWSVGNSNVENADLCEWEYGNVVFERDMTVWNMKGSNNQRFLVQQNFDRVGRKCVLQGK